MYVDYELVGKRLARRRRELGLRQYEVCEKAGLNDKYLSCLETARSVPSIDVLMRVCDALETTPDAILLGAVTNPERSDIDTLLSNSFSALDKRSKKLALSFMDWLKTNEIFG